MCPYPINNLFLGNKNRVVCKNCHKPYFQLLDQQIEGFRIKDYDICPYCGYENGSSMTYEYYNEPLNQVHFGIKNSESLYKKLTDFCHDQYRKTDCNNCNHQICCPGNPRKNCKQCLEEIHFPYKYPNGRKDYDCKRMLYFYVCDYVSKYASEILYLLRESNALNEIDNYNVLSIGCGACPDLIAFERYCQENEFQKTVKYYGIDVNEKWKTIHNVIRNYKTSYLIKAQFEYSDAVKENCIIQNVNIIVLQYVISHFYNNGQIIQIDSFFQKFVEEFVKNKQKNAPMIILINDVNSTYRGRDYFSDLEKKILSSGFHCRSNRYYFDYKIQHPEQRYGNKHEKNCVLFEIPKEYESIYYPWHYCTSAQMLIEVG